MTLGPLRVAAVSATATAGDVPANVAAAADWVRRAGSEGAAVVVLPELFLPGYDPATLRRSPDACDVTAGDPRLDPLTAAAAETGTVAVVGASVRETDGSRSLAVLAVSRSGEVRVAYAKQHLWNEERGIFAAGRRGASVEVDGWPLGLGVCYDGCFPDHARAAAADGALAYLCPSAYVVGSEHRRDLYYAARALDNGIYVAFAGLVGRCGELAFSGGSAIYDPQGRPVTRVEEGRPGMAVADLRLDVVEEARRINPYDHDRVADLGGRSTLVLR